MPTGIYKHTPEMYVTRIGRKRRPFSVEWRKKLSDAKKKNPPKYWLGKKHSKQTRMLLSRRKKEMYLRHPERKKTIGEEHRGDKCYFWKGGISNTPYSIDWTNSLKISIRERDKYVCQICKEKQGDKAHAVHHIDYDKNNNNPSNLITLCNRCHTKTNHNRETWITFFCNQNI